MNNFLKLLLLLPFASIAQTDNKGIKFEQGLSWDQVRLKAQVEQKSIFVDCYATWCAPCKIMDDEVYSNESVGTYMNDKFISVKIQMDSSRNDSRDVREWYRDAFDIKQKYTVNSMPTYLFFSKDGKAVHKDVGSKGVGDFINMVARASNMQQQYYTLLGKYMKKEISYSEMPTLAIMAKNIDESELSLKIASDYMRGHLDQLSDDKFCAKENLAFIGSFFKMLNSKDRAFEMYFYNSQMVDSVMGKGYSNGFVNYIIYKEELTPIINSNKSSGTIPNWGKLKKTIREKYNAGYADHNVLSAQVSWYKYQKKWRQYSKYLVRYINNLGVENLDVFNLNNSAFEVFKYSNKRQELLAALSWIDRALPMEINYPGAVMDTKANILYKLNRRTEAISLEGKAAELSPTDKGIQETLVKMKRGEKTWPL